jgi:ATP-dependent DNA helicase RecQ
VKVLIVAKTRRGQGACVGGISEDGRSVRLVASDAATNAHAGLEYAIGDVWEIDGAADPNATAPHLENVIVGRATRLRCAHRVQTAIAEFMPPLRGGFEVLFDGLTQATAAGALYVCERTGLPRRSTMFWLSDQPLRLDSGGKRIRYRYPTADGGRSLTFVGFQEPLPELPAGTILRVSLAHPWRPKEHPEEESRCFAQLSGWFLHDPAFPDMGDAPIIDRSRCATAAAAPCLDAALEILKGKFGFDRFLPPQAEVIGRVLAKRDALVVMPTGGGKSLCYQLPALMFGGLTVVVSPLVALMQDQVRLLAALRLPAACLNHMVPLHEWTVTTNAVRNGAVKLLYVAPETLLRPETLLLVEQSRLECLAVDEAHCISSWGHDFRPDYRQLPELRRRFPTTVCLALTATATARVRHDIRQLLGIPASGEFIASFDRPNLFLQIERRQDAIGQILHFLQSRRGRSGIIYCGTRRQVEELCGDLKINGWPALPYHAGLPDHVRRHNQEQFISGQVALIVATIAFGMGINKADVRFVIHAHLPKDLESYYQEIGRAGRDGQPAHCLLLHSRRDVIVQERFIDQGASSQRVGRLDRLEALVRFAEAPGCRRKQLLSYFGEDFHPPCKQCDHCAPSSFAARVRGVTEAARKFLTQDPSVRAPRHHCFHEIGELFAAGRTLDELARRRQVAPQTIMGYLEQFVKEGGQIDPARVLAVSKLSESDRSRVLRAFQRLGLDTLSPVRAVVGATISYDELRVLRLYLLCR